MWRRRGERAAAADQQQTSNPEPEPKPRPAPCAHLGARGRHVVKLDGRAAEALRARDRLARARALGQLLVALDLLRGVGGGVGGGKEGGW